MERPKIYNSKSKGEIEIASMHSARASMSANLLERNGGDQATIDALRVHAHEQSLKWEAEHEAEVKLWTDQQRADRATLAAHYARIMGQ